MRRSEQGWEKVGKSGGFVEEKGVDGKLGRADDLGWGAGGGGCSDGDGSAKIP